MASNTRPLAVVTGASSGIGYELAKLCAEPGTAGEPAEPERGRAAEGKG